MPQKNSIKTYVDNGYYHIYNRGVEKRTIFEDDQDYKVFLKYLKQYLTKQPNYLLHGEPQGGSLRLHNYHNKIDLVAFCLMPNHFHLLIKQISQNDMESFMRSLATRYSMFFNKKYSRVGKLFQGHYKARMIVQDSDLLHLTKYIHTNPKDNFRSLENAYSSYANYVKKEKNGWIKPDIVLNFFKRKKNILFKNVQSYKSFVENYEGNSKEILGSLTLE